MGMFDVQFIPTLAPFRHLAGLALLREKLREWHVQRMACRLGYAQHIGDELALGAIPQITDGWLQGLDARKQAQGKKSYP